MLMIETEVSLLDTLLDRLRVRRRLSRFEGQKAH